MNRIKLKLTSTDGGSHECDYDQINSDFRITDKFISSICKQYKIKKLCALSLLIVLTIWH